ncbi:MAG: phage tail protein [Paludibacteraceae bacterium]|nr:phage tail protein [Paludibacteraceae bacterium]
MNIVGTVIPYAGIVDTQAKQELKSKGWLFCDGSAVSRTEYNDLFNVIKIMYGGGDGVNTFNLPNYQGQFLRGVSNNSGVDPDANTRTPQQNGKDEPGTSKGNTVGTFQQDQIIRHNHPIKLWSRSFKGDDDSDRPFDNLGSDRGYSEINENGGAETRSKNVSVNYLISFKA